MVTWTDDLHGGDSSSVSSQLTSGVTQIASANHSFSALKTDGSVVMWGSVFSSSYPQFIGETSQIVSGHNASAELKADGSLVAYGKAANGGDSSAVTAQLSSGVVSVVANSYAMAALKGDGSVVM